MAKVSDIDALRGWKEALGRLDAECKVDTLRLQRALEDAAEGRRENIEGALAECYAKAADISRLAEGEPFATLSTSYSATGTLKG